MEVSTCPRVDCNVKHFQIPGTHGPPISWVTRRVTIDLDRDVVIQDVDGQHTKTQFPEPLPSGVTNIRTLFTYFRLLPSDTPKTKITTSPPNECAGKAGGEQQSELMVTDAVPSANRPGGEHSSPIERREEHSSLCRRRIVEYCCGPNSLIGQLAPKDCSITRITEAENALTAKGLDLTIKAVTPTDGVKGILLFASIPCPGLVLGTLST